MPTIQLDNCITCLKCVHDCPSGAISIETGSIDSSCIHCGHCVAICPESTIFPDAGEIKKLKPAAILPTDFEHLAANLRTCRSFLNKEVESATLQQLVENMKHYPSASNARPLEITLVQSGAIIQKLNDQTANGLIKTLRFITAAWLRPLLKVLVPKFDVSGLARYKKQFIERQVPESSQVCHHAPLVMLFHAPKTRYGMAAADAYIWATYTTLYAHTLGLGTCFNGFISMGMKRSKAMRNEFNIPAGQQVYAALLIGYPKVNYVNEVGREKPGVHIL